ncbi:hypothetical protein Clacol_008328 [Clathrus columnatus]|uniref:Heme haloperoxidase family profile domain-containing protein n=1 Tax=Clathrus columnatus TaxID=1419009 RepID=A0AAV5AHE5_9AGAM|nr:hypothetical protein Clacol_008328 [Clathrus columnatus]
MAKISILLLPVFVKVALAIPAYGSLAGLTQRQVDDFIANNTLAPIPPPPGPLVNDGLLLVNDPSHPFIQPGPDDLRGPCPGLNTLANHGVRKTLRPTVSEFHFAEFNQYLPRSGVARPDQLVTAVMEGFNLGNDFARFLVYQAHLIDGNPITNLISIGMKTPQTGPDPPAPAIVGGLSQHGTFEGDTSMTRVDAFFGNPAIFNETRFDEFSAFSMQFGVNGTYDINAAAELRHQRLEDSIQTNPELSFQSPRILSAFSEAVFPTIFFVDGRLDNGQLNLQAARSFFQPNKFPDNFFRQPAPVSFPTIQPLTQQLFDKHPFVPGMNNGTNNFIELPDTPALSDFCGIYDDIVNRVLKTQYPNPSGPLLEALQTNLNFLFSAVEGHNCTQAFPFGQ